MTWERAFDVTRCGGPCGQAIPKGAPVLQIVAGAMTRRLLRCSACASLAGYPEPSELPELVSPPPRQTSAPSTMVRISAGIKALPFDWKSRSAGREPGSDD